MHAKDVTVEWLQSISYTPKSVASGPTIDGVIVKDLRALPDGRGDVIELWSLPWTETQGMIVPTHVYQLSLIHI